MKFRLNSPSDYKFLISTRQTIPDQTTMLCYDTSKPAESTSIKIIKHNMVKKFQVVFGPDLHPNVQPFKKTRSSFFFICVPIWFTKSCFLVNLALHPLSMHRATAESGDVAGLVRNGSRLHNSHILFQLGPIFFLFYCMIYAQFK